MPGISRTDIIDVDIVDQAELGSDKTTVYFTATLVSTASGTQQVTIQLPADGAGVQHRDHPLEAGDIAVITGSGGADGTYTVGSVVSDTEFIVVEAIASSTGGSASFRYPAGASKVGFDPTSQTITTAHNIQEAMTDIANAVGSGPGSGSAGFSRAVRCTTYFADINPLEGLLTIDLTPLSEGDSVLLKDQADGTENGVWIASAGAWTRAPDWTTGNVVSGLLVHVASGYANAQKAFMVTTAGPITVGVTAVSFTELRVSTLWDLWSVGGTAGAGGVNFLSFGGDISLSADGVVRIAGSGGIQIPPGVVPAAPTAGLNMFVKSVANRPAFGAIAPGGPAFQYQADLFHRNVAMWSPQTGATLGVFGMGSTNTGTLSTPALATTNHLTRMRRTRFSSDVAAGSDAGAYGVEMVWRGNAADHGGFRVDVRFCIELDQPEMRAFVGLYASTTALGNADPSTLLDIIGMSLDATDSNWQLITNDTTGTATKTDLGASFARSTTAVYDMHLYCSPNASEITWQCTELSSATTVTGAITTDLPGDSVFYTPFVWATNNAQADAVQISLMRFYIEWP